MSKIPIENVYYLLCYAWGHAEEADMVDVAELEGVEHVYDLLGTVLSEGTSRLLRRGLDRGYRELRHDVAGIRGKWDIGETAKTALRRRGRTACVFEELSHDVPHNRILKSTLRLLLRLPKLDKRVRDKVRAVYDRLEGISQIRVDRHAFRQIQLDRNRRTYLFLLSVCALVHEESIASEHTGEARFRDFRDDYAKMWQLFEDFVKEFYVREQQEYRVNPGGRRIRWFGLDAATPEDRTLVPRMSADVILDGPSRRIVLDAKFYLEALTHRFGKPKLKSGNLYQLLAYLRNREATTPPGPKHEGILLYPVVDSPLAADVRLEGFRIQARGVDLGQAWRDVRHSMLDVLA
jgi:5-methylcytosine-specific restriction enzyme subunit McrC